ncbi:MAG: SMC family ATPase [Nocardioides sp.]
MRLHHLSVTAFGPFVDTAEVDFDLLSDAGLFLLSGATGAGKSSVLDAVCFALYGAVPGDRHQAGRLRSDQAPPGLAPQVGLEVTLAERRFRVVRSPAYDRPKKRGTGTTREPAKVSLSERRGDTWQPLTSRLDEAGDLLGGLLGMNLDQFCQVALLPQGQFQAFLRADSHQRQALLARLFRTGRFERVEGWLRDHRLTLRRASEGHRELVADLVSRVSEAAGVAVPEALDDLGAGADDGRLSAWAEGLRDEAAAVAAAADEACTPLREAESAARDLVEVSREQAAARSRVAEAAATAARLDDRADDHAVDVHALDRARRADGLRPLVRLVDERVDHRVEAGRRAELSLAAAGPLGDGLLPFESALADALDDVSADLAAVAALLPAERRLSELRSALDTRLETLRDLVEAEALEAAEMSALEGQTERLTGELAAAEAAELALPRATTELTGLQTVVSAFEEQARLGADLALATVDRSAAVARVLDLRERLLDLRERRIAGMAAELAGALAVGHECPVCGSADHPRPARAAEGHPDAARERAAQRALDDAQAVEAALSMRVHELETLLAACRAVIGDREPDAVRTAAVRCEQEQARLTASAQGRAALTDALADAHVRVAALEETQRSRQVTLVETTTTLEHLRGEAAELEATVAAARGADPALASTAERLEARRIALRTAHADALAHEASARALADAEVALRRAALEAGFDTVDDARVAMLPTGEVTGLEQRVRDHEAALAASRRVLAEPGAAELLATAAPDLEVLARAQREAADALERARATADAASRLHERVASLHTELETAVTAWQPVRDDLRLATAVSAFAEGKAADNRHQMRLSAYVLAHRLSQVVAAANARLAAMSDQRYSLEHVTRRGAGESRGGLSLVVRDDWSGESRDPATLSGGETFVVSLALALGLADVVAHEAGGADLATLFVDEGFGSLDAETLDDVLDILDTLRANGRAVGVVSHVAEMRHRIPAQLVVTKARTGSTVRLAGVAG